MTKKQTKTKAVKYKWQPQWQYLDNEDLLHFFVQLPIKINQKQYEDKEFPPRLKRQFTKLFNFYRFDGRLDNVEIDDIAYLSQFLKITLPQEIVEHPSFNPRVVAHLERQDNGGYLWKPNTKLLDLYDVPPVIAHYDYTVPEDTYKNFSSRLKTHFKQV